MGAIEKTIQISVSLAKGEYVGAALEAVGIAEGFAYSEAEKRFNRWWKGVVEDSGWETPQEVQGLIEAKIQESKGAKESVWAAARELLYCLSDDSAEVIGSLTAEYVRSGTSPDAFFRGAIRTLADLNSEELDLLRRMVRFGCEGPEKVTYLVVKQEGTLVQQKGVAKVLRVSPTLGGQAELRRILRVLKSNDLAREGSSGTSGSMSGPNVAVVELAVFQRLKHHLG